MTQTIPVANSTAPQEKPAGLPCTGSSASFWHSWPNVFLLGHRTTADLPTHADVVIVGSGITGASAARFLGEDERAKDLTVVMLEAREICWGATGRNGGHCQPLLFDQTPDIAEWEVKNVNEVRSYIEKHEVDCDWRSVTGCRTFWSTRSYEYAKRKVNELKSVSPEMGDLVEATTDVDEMKRHRVKPNCAGITLTQGAGQLWPYKYVTFIVEKLVKEGKLNVQTRTPVTDIGFHQGDLCLDTPRGTIKANKVILATNGYTSHLLPDFTSLIVPTRCEMSALHPPTKERLPDSYGMVAYQSDNPEHDDYLVQLPFRDGRGGQLMFGGGRGHAMYNCVGESDDDIVDPGEADYLRRVLPQMLELGTDKELVASHQWTGIKGYSRDSKPWVGEVSPGILLCAGYTGHGMPNATLCAKAVVEMALTDEEYGDVVRKLVANKDLPESFVITGPRIENALKMPRVWEQDMLARF